MSDIKSVLFICTGNSCRSVMAEALLRKYLKKLGKGHIKVSSAGIRGVSSGAPTEETLKALESEGIELKGFRSKSVTEKMIKEADLILAMEKMHKDEILNIAPEAANKTFLLKEYGRSGALDGGGGSGIQDPIGHPIEFYKYIMKVLKKETERIAEIL